MGAYYYAGGQRIELERDEEHVAIDRDAAEHAGVDPGALGGGQSAPRSGSGIILAPRSGLAPQHLEQLRKAGALHPAYRRERAVVVPLPEVRVEFDTPQQRDAVKAFLAEQATASSITDETDDWLVVRPLSGRGDDALAIANEIHERVHAAASSVRFVQFVPKPTSVR